MNDDLITQVRSMATASRRQGAELWYITPAMLDRIATELEANRKALGEQTDMVRRWRNRAKNAQHKANRWRTKAEAR